MYVRTYIHTYIHTYIYTYIFLALCLVQGVITYYLKKNIFVLFLKIYSKVRTSHGLLVIPDVQCKSIENFK